MDTNETQQNTTHCQHYSFVCTLFALRFEPVPASEPFLYGMDLPNSFLMFVYSLHNVRSVRETTGRKSYGIFALRPVCFLECAPSFSASLRYFGILIHIYILIRCLMCIIIVILPACRLVAHASAFSNVATDAAVKDNVFIVLHAVLHTAPFGSTCSFGILSTQCALFGLKNRFHNRS